MSGAGQARQPVRMNRRTFLRNGAYGLGAVGLAALLEACASSTSGTGAGGSASAAAGFDWSAQHQTDEFVFANWPFYIDKAKVNGEVVHPSIEAFTKQTGIDVKYLEVIQDYPSFFGKIQPVLAQGDPTGFDMIVMGYPRWFPAMIALDYLIPLDDDLLPNFNANAAPKFLDPPFDPGHGHGVPFASGATGIGYNIDLTGREITSIKDLFDPAFKGKVGMFNDTEDMPNFTLLGLGVEPSESTPDDWQRAADWLREQRDSGILRKYYGQGYIGDLQSGDLALTMAWSPDIHQSNLSGYDNLKFVVPEEGGLLWTDYFCIPKGSASPMDAIMWMDFTYKPEIAAMITSWVGAMSPVPQAQVVLKEQGQGDVANSELVFPTQQMYDQLHAYRTLTPDEQQQWDNLFVGVMEGV
jgi:spermidine/putrescine transport system substrate-binding protein